MKATSLAALLLSAVALGPACERPAPRPAIDDARASPVDGALPPAPERAWERSPLATLDAGPAQLRPGRDGLPAHPVEVLPVVASDPRRATSLREVVLARVPELRHCYVAALPGATPRAYRIELRLAIAPDGTVIDVSTVHNPGAPAAMELCVRRVLARAAWPAPGGRAALVGLLPLRFGTEGAPDGGSPRGVDAAPSVL